MKRRLFALLVVLAIVCAAVPSLAATPEYDTTEDFLDALKAKDISYTFNGTDSDGDEKVTIRNTCDEYGSMSFLFFFSSDEEDVSARIWNVINFDAVNRAAVLEVCNQANYDYRFCTFFVDDSDNSVTMSADAYLPSRNPGDLCVDLLETMHTILKRVYPSLAPYAR